MQMSRKQVAVALVVTALFVAFALLGDALLARGDKASQPPKVVILYKPYIEPGDASRFGLKDQMVIAWQTNEQLPHSGAYSVQFGKGKFGSHNRCPHRPCGR